MKYWMILFLLVSVACTEKKNSEQTNAPMSAEDLVARGKVIYESNCVACHGVNPKLDGNLGPAVAGSSLELLEARVLRAQYPAGYTPKKSTASMVALPHLEKEIPALHAYLQK